jgi:hypothetical protein
MYVKEIAGNRKFLNIIINRFCRLPDSEYSIITNHVQRVSAKHGVKDDFAFLWEHAIFRHPPNKNPLTDRSEILHN